MPFTWCCRCPLAILYPSDWNFRICLRVTQKKMLPNLWNTVKLSYSEISFNRRFSRNLTENLIIFNFSRIFFLCYKSEIICKYAAKVWNINIPTNSPQKIMLLAYIVPPVWEKLSNKWKSTSACTHIAHIYSRTTARGLINIYERWNVVVDLYSSLALYPSFQFWSRFDAIFE